MEILTEFDGLQEALKKVKMDESVMPYVNGRLVDDGAWNKTQKILNCPEMISAHKYLYNLDMDQLTEEEIEKIDQLYKLGCDRGFIADDLTDWDADGSASEQKAEEKPVEEPVEKTPAEKATTTLFKAKVPCWTVIYSATSKDGEIKTGEAYSNAVTASAAKADVNAKLSRIGYSNISILAIESCDCDVAGATTVVNDVEEAEDIEENDMLRNRPHNAHIDDPAGIVSEKDDEESSDDAEDAEPEDDSSEESEDGSDDSSDDAGDDDASSDEEADADDGDDSSEDSSEDDSEESSDEEADDEDSSDAEDDSSDEDSDENSDDEDSEEDSDKEDDDSDDEDSEEDSDDDEEKEELDANEKSELRDEYRRTFKNVLSKCKFTKSFNDLTLEEKVKFFTELSKAWKKNEPNEFMTDKEIDQLNNVVVNEEND